MISEVNSKKLDELRKTVSATSPARQRLEYLFDDGDYTELDAFTMCNDSLAGVVTAYGYVEGSPVYAFSQDKTVKSGAVGRAHSAKICKVLELAAKTGVPVIGIHDSNGAFIDGGIDALSAYSEMLMWTSNISGVVPQIAVIAGVCAGSAAMIACSSDIVVMTKNSEFFMTPPFDTSKDGMGSAGSAAKSGTAAIICDDDKTAMEKVKRIISMLPMNNLSPIPVFESVLSDTVIGTTAESIAQAVADAESVIELYPRFGKASYTAFATINGATVGMVATNKTADKLGADDCTKITRFVKICDAYAVPIITFIDSEGFEASDLTSSIRDMARLANVYAESTTIKLSVIVGKAYGATYIAMAGKNANADMTFAWADAVITPLAPETAVEFLWHDKLKGASDLKTKRTELANEYAQTVASVFEAAAKNCVDEIITPEETRTKLRDAIEILAGKRVTKLPKKHNII